MLRRPRSAFTLIELLVCISILAVISAVGFVSLGNYRGQQAVQSAVDEMDSVVRATRQRSMAQESGGRWGVHFTNAATGISSYTVFRGYAFATGTADRQYPLPSNVSFSNPFASSTYDVVFAPLTGAVSEAKMLSVVSGRSSAPVGDLVVKSNGSAVSRLEHGLVGYWHFDEGAATTTYDASGNSNAGTLTNGPTWQTGSSCKAGGCLSFDGSSNYVDVPDSNALDIGTADFSILAWIKTSNSNFRIIISKGSACQGDSASCYRLNTYNGGTVGAYIQSGNGNTWIGSTGATKVVSDNVWHHVAAVFNRSGNMIVYVDGIQDSSTDISLQNASLANSSDLQIGRRASGTFFEGSMDEVRIYNRALSASEILNQYNDLK